jgi:2-phosphoglycerate kinase
MTERRYADPLPLGGPDGPPYSKGLMARALIATGLAAEPAYLLARRVELDLADRNARSVEFDRLQDLAIELLGGDLGKHAIRQLRRYRDLQQLDVPIVLLVGGATGTGKSTIATELAHRLGITRVTSTDFIRQTMRAFFATEFMPSIHHSSFDVGLALRHAQEDEAGDPVLLGFLEQSRNVLVGVNAAIERALQEGWSMVLEGIHLVPGMLPVLLEGAVVVQFVLRIDDEKAHASHFWVRDVSTTGVRPMERYLDRLPEIRAIQDYLVERAERVGVPVVEGGNIERSIGAVMELVFAEAEQMQALEV